MRRLHPLPHESPNFLRVATAYRLAEPRCREREAPHPETLARVSRYNGRRLRITVHPASDPEHDRPLAYYMRQAGPKRGSRWSLVLGLS